MGGLGGAAMIGMHLMKQQNQSIVKGNFDSDALLTVNQINAILADPNKCSATLAGKNALSTTSGINAINGSSFYSLDSGLAPAAGYGNGRLQIQNYTLSATNADVTANKSLLLINLQNKNILKGTNGQSTIQKKIELYVEVDGAKNITKCRSLSSASTDIWSRGSGSDIFYSGGKIGVGTAAPQVALHVAGAFSPGDETQASTCNASTEGSQRYNKALHQMQYCAYQAGPPVTYAWQALGGTGYSTITIRTNSRYVAGATGGAGNDSITSVNCLANEKVLSGGGTCITGYYNNHKLDRSYPTATGWTVRCGSVMCDSDSCEYVTVTAYAQCAK